MFKLSELVAEIIEIYAETRHCTADERADAERELRCYLSPLIESSDHKHSLHLIAKGLRHLRELEGRPAPPFKAIRSQTAHEPGTAIIQ
jgi:hypothetical protein